MASIAKREHYCGVNVGVGGGSPKLLQLSEAALVGLGVPAGSAIATIHEKRDEFRRVMQGLSRGAGAGAVRLKRTNDGGTQ